MHPDKKLVLNGVVGCGVVLWGFGWCWFVWGVGGLLVWVWGFIRVRCALRVCGQILPCKIDFTQTKTPTSCAIAQNRGLLVCFIA